MSALASIEWEMTCVLEDIEEVKGQDKATTALSSLRRTYRELRKDYSAEKERLRLAGHDDTEALTPEQAIAGLRQMVAIAPEQVIEALEEAIELRRNPPDRLEG